MLRRLTAICAFLACGVVATVGVAWAGAAWSSIAQSAVPPTAEWIAAESPVVAVEFNDHSSFEARSSCATLRTDIARSMWDNSGHSVSSLVRWRHELRAGFPFNTLRWSYDQTFSTLPLGPNDSFETGIGIPDSTDIANTHSWRRLPLEPIPAGFAANTVLWAVAFFAFARLMAHGRVSARRARARCTHCGYRLHEAPVCPECGHHARAV